MRPNCDKILEMPIVQKRMIKLFPGKNVIPEDNILLKTIHVPKNLLYLTNQLPSANYDHNNSQNSDYFP
jgi:hypothetical protein